MKKPRTLLLFAFAFFVPMTVMLLVLRNMGFYPLGDKSLLIMDMADQYVQFYEYLPYIASGEGSIFFSWSKSYGTNFTGLFAYYLSSPLSLLMLLFKDAQLGIFWLTVLKIGLCGAGSFVYFYNVRKCKGPAILLFTTAYALMSYNIVYSMSLMWLDAVILLPVILTGAEKILSGGKPWVFIVSLAALLISNYYTGYMVCLFSVLYIVCRYFTQPRDERALGVPRALGTFAGAYAVALALAAWLLLPAFLDLMTGKIGHSNYTPDEIGNFPLRSYILSFLPRTYTSITTDGIPALYTGVLTIVLCLFYFATANIRMREKLLTGALFTVLLCSFYFEKLDIAWHIFQHPNWFPYRYAFVFQFLAVSTGCAGWQALKRVPSKKVNIAIQIVLMVLVCLDTGTNASALFKGLDEQFGYRPVESHTNFRAQTKPIVDAVQSMDEGFYRVEKTYKHSMNDALGMGYRGITHYSSMFSRELLSTTKKLGMAQTYIWNGYIGSTPATDALFNVKYVLSKTALPYEKVHEQNGITVYENPYVLPVAFAWSSGMSLPGAEFQSAGGNHDCFAYQNEIYRTLGGEDVFIPAHDVQKDGMSYTVVSNGKPVYAYFPVLYNSSRSLFLNDELIMPYYFSADDNNAVYIGTFEEGRQIVVSFDEAGETPKLHGEFIYTLDTEALHEITQHLRAGGMTDITYTASGLRGQIYAEHSGSLFISVPFDAGWSVKIDGARVEAEPALGAFMTVPIDEGEHTVEMSFRPQGFAIGITISTLAFLGLVIFIALTRRLTKR